MDTCSTGPSFQTPGAAEYPGRDPGDRHRPRYQPPSLSWDLPWNGGYVYLFDMSRGIEVPKLREGASTSARAAGSLPSVSAPSTFGDRHAKATTGADAKGRYVCPLFKIAAERPKSSTRSSAT
jgi:hypothetical protein